jgi:hypothetical protein
MFHRFDPREWSWTFNEGGRWFTFTLWRGIRQYDNQRSWSGVRAWFGPRFGDYVMFEFGIQLGWPRGRSKWTEESSSVPTAANTTR